jgi:transcriptional regulator with XRE-family HTH domain
MGPNPVDVSVGGRIRLRRRLLKVSQERLAYDLGLTPQQVQKYERARNGVSASRLYQIARSLGAPVAYFFEDLADPGHDAGAEGEAAPTEQVHAFLMTPEGVELARLFPQIPRRLRRHLLELVRDLAARPEGEGAGAAPALGLRRRGLPDPLSGQPPGGPAAGE